MAQSSNRKTWLRLGAGVSLLTLSSAFGLAAPALAQQQPAAEGTGDVVVVTGFRGSLAAAIEVKREENGIVDVITAEDIADFPDLNLAESLQRVPGVQSSSMTHGTSTRHADAATSDSNATSPLVVSLNVSLSPSDTASVVVASGPSQAEHNTSEAKR